MDTVNWFKLAFLSRWNEGLMGQCVSCSIEILSEEIHTAEEATLKVPLSPLDLLAANICAALSTEGHLGSATKSTLKSVKTRMDVSAAHAFSRSLQQSDSFSFRVSTSEGKDECGNFIEDPLAALAEIVPDGYGIAVDVIDGTTLAAQGSPGAYTLSASARSLVAFPDMQAYAVMAPPGVLDRFDFQKKPEVAVEDLVTLLGEYHGKTARDLSIVTHSYDTGRHHTELIETLKALGVRIEVPDPVIVEPPYTLSCGLGTRGSPDAMIGVFGLPEIVINTLLLAILNRDCCIRFRIASNSMLRVASQETLNSRFEFSREELSQLSAMGLSVEKVYDKDSIAAGFHGAAFVATALTDDRVLGLHGLHKVAPATIAVETIFSGFKGLTLKLSTHHRLENRVELPAAFPQKIADLSLIARVGEGAVRDFCEVVSGALATSKIAESLEIVPRGDHHVTLFEFGTHYGGVDKEVVKAAIEQCREQIKFFVMHPCRFIPGGLKVTENAIILEITNDSPLFDLTSTKWWDGDFFNIMKTPDLLHVTLARFKMYTTSFEMEKLRELIASLQSQCAGMELVAVPMLVLIEATPFGDVVNVGE